MTKEQIDQYDMLLSVENHFDDNTTVWTSVPPLAASKALLTAKIRAIGEQAALQLLNTDGITASKDAARAVLEDQTFVIGSALAGYASIIANKDLYERNKYTPTALTRFRDAELIGVSTNLLRDANTEMANLAPYGVLPANTVTLNTNINAFGAIMKNPTEAISKRKSATDKLVDLIPEAITILETRLDNLVVAIASTQTNFVDVYRNVRAINSSPTSAWSLTTTCLDSQSQLPIAGVKLSIVGERMDRISSDTGFNTYQNLKEGSYTINATHPNYQDATVAFTIVAGITTELMVTMNAR
jgi:hypothetical protein